MEHTGHIFGNSKLKKIKTGDLVRWHTLAKEGAPDYKENIGIVTDVCVDHRGGRYVAMAKIIPLGPDYPPGTRNRGFFSVPKGDFQKCAIQVGDLVTYRSIKELSEENYQQKIFIHGIGV
jgi:hypothetical protein